MYINAQEEAVPVSLAPGCGAVREFAWEDATNRPVNIIVPKY
jgi:hypothetical protein